MKKSLSVCDLTFCEAMGYPDRGTEQEQQAYLSKIAKSRKNLFRIEEDVPEKKRGKKKPATPSDARTSFEMHVDAVIETTAKELGLPSAGPLHLDELRKLVLLAKDRIAEPKKPEPKQLSPFVSRNELIAAIRIATSEREVCTPSNDYYAGGNDWTRDTIRFVDAEELIRWLETPQE